MNRTQKIEYARNYLQEKLEEGFPYPFRVFFEDGQLLFLLKNGRKECRAKTHQSDDLIETIVGGTQEEKEKVLERLFQILRAAVTAEESTALADISDYDKIKEELILRPLAYERVKEELTETPYIRYCDVVLVLYAVMAHEGNDYFTTRIRRSQMVGWKRKEEELLEEALANTSLLYPPRLYAVEDLFAWDKKRPGDGKFMNETQEVRMNSSMRGYVLTNTLEINGAVALFYPGVARRLAVIFGGDFYIAFTSVHEAQIHSVGLLTPAVIEESLRDTNDHCNRQEDILTDRVYLYRAEERKFYVYTDGEWLEVARNEG